MKRNNKNFAITAVTNVRTTPDFLQVPSIKFGYLETRKMFKKYVCGMKHKLDSSVQFLFAKCFALMTS
jgi:hypothetical protein